jgi:Phosphate transporter family
LTRPQTELLCCRSGIADLNEFLNAPVLLMYGFMCVAATAAIWDNLATLLYLPVSTTHTTGAHVRAPQCSQAPCHLLPSSECFPPTLNMCSQRSWAT